MGFLVKWPGLDFELLQFVEPCSGQSLTGYPIKLSAAAAAAALKGTNLNSSPGPTVCIKCVCLNMFVVGFYTVFYEYCILWIHHPKVSRRNPSILNMAMDILIPVSLWGYFLYLLVDAIAWLCLAPDPTLPDHSRCSVRPWCFMTNALLLIHFCGLWLSPYFSTLLCEGTCTFDKCARSPYSCLFLLVAWFVSQFLIQVLPHCLCLSEFPQP